MPNADQFFVLVSLVALVAVRAVKARLPKAALPWMAIGVSVAAYVAAALSDDADVGRAALNGLLAGAAAIAAHDGSKGAALALLGRLAGAPTAGAIVAAVFGEKRE